MPAAYPRHLAATSASRVDSSVSGEFDRRLDVALGDERARDQAYLLGLLEQSRRALAIGAGGHLEARLDDEVRKKRLALDTVQRAFDLAIECLPRKFRRLRYRAKAQ